MDTIRDLRSKKKRKEPGSAKRSPDNITNTTGENEMADDLKKLPEFDYENPEMKMWMDQEDARQKKSLAGVTREDAVAFVDELIANKKTTVRLKS